MKGSFYGLKGKQLSLFTIVLMCSKRCWFSFNSLFVFSPWYKSALSEQEIDVGKGVATFTQKDTVKEELRLGAPPGLNKALTKGKRLVTNLLLLAFVIILLTVFYLTIAPVCNYAKGKWVVDHKKPLYSGHGCKQWLSSMWSYRMTQRTDFSYEKVSWQPKDCQMEEFEGSKFLKRFIGPTGGKERHDVIIDVGPEYGIVQARGDVRPSGWAYRFPTTNTTILYSWSSTLCDLQPIDASNPATHYAMHLDRPPAFLRQYIHKLNVLVLNTGHHWNRGKLKANRWVMLLGGVRNTDRKIAVIWKANNATYPGLKAFYRTISPRHFVGGEWNTGGSCDNTTLSSDSDAAGAAKGTGVKLLDTTALSKVRDEGHISRFSKTAKPGVQDCLHWCLPAVPDTWNEILLAQI
ncbi:unnamed protein product [Malus baccata var. baccata]